MSTNDFRGYYLKVLMCLTTDHKMSSDAAQTLCDKYKQLIIDGFEAGEGPVPLSKKLATQDKREAHEPGTKWSAGIATGRCLIRYAPRSRPVVSSGICGS